jgi:hypothetical protein
MSQSPRKFEGTTGWYKGKDGGEAPVEQAILHTPSHMGLDVHYGGHRYTVQLYRTAGSDFTGQFVATDTGGRLQGEVKCRMLVTEEEALLIGIWHEEGDSYRWFAILRRVA